MSILERLRLAATERFWGRVASGHALTTWLHEPVVRRYVNTCVSGDPNVWPMDFLAPSFGTIDRALSLGCSDGALERVLRTRNWCRSVTGLDISQRALAIAREEAREEGLDGIDYRRCDLNAPGELAEARSCDAVFFQQSLHHVANLEGCLDAVAAALRPGGLVYLDEYVGPSRSEWTRRLLDDADAVYRALPRSVRRRRHVEIPVEWRDPSEAVRSSEIVREVSRRFTIETRRDYGGTFLSVIYPHLDLAGLDAARREAILESVIAAERSAIDGGASAYYTVIAARSRA